MFHLFFRFCFFDGQQKCIFTKKQLKSRGESFPIGEKTFFSKISIGVGGEHLAEHITVTTGRIESEGFSCRHRANKKKSREMPFTFTNTIKLL